MDSFENPDNTADNHLLDTEEEFIEIPTPDYDTTYRELNGLVFDGFIPVRLDLFDSKLILKSLSPNEFRYIDLISETVPEKVSLWFLYSLVFIDGKEILPVRKELHDASVQTFKSLTSKTLNHISLMLNSVQMYYSKAYDNLEGFLYEKEPRQKWSVYKKSALNSLLPGFTEYNTAQEVWVNFNQREDDRLNIDMAFSNAKFIASAFAGSKEIRKIEKTEKMRWNEELQRRQAVRLKNKSDKIRLIPTVNTAEDLVKQLESQMKGEMDLHDKIISQYEQKLADRLSQRRVEMELLRNKMLKDAEGKQSVSGGSRPITKEEMDEKIRLTESLTLDQRVFEQNDRDHYISKIEQTMQKRPAQKAAEVGINQKSVFDDEVQAELQKLLNIKK